MDATKSRQRLTAAFAPLFKSVRGSTASRLVLPVAPLVAIIVGTVIALVFIVMPTETLENLSEDSGVASMITAAEPPLGLTARFAIAFIAAIAVGAAVWFGTFLLIGARTVILKRGKRADGVPVLRRADAHPDAPARRPVFANSDLGTPFLDVKAAPDAPAFVPPAVATDIPADLDTPLAAYLTPNDDPLPEPEPLPIMAEPPVPEPAAFDVPVPTAAPAPIAPPRFAPHERIETFELTPMVRTPEPEAVTEPIAVAEPIAAAEPAIVAEPAPETSAPLPPATIHDLLARLERGVQRRAEAVAAVPEPVAAEPAEPSLEDTLSVLRQLAARVG